MSNVEKYNEIENFIIEYVKHHGPMTYTEIRDAIIFKFYRDTWNLAENVLSSVEKMKWIEVDETPSKSKTWRIKKI